MGVLNTPGSWGYVTAVRSGRRLLGTHSVTYTGMATAQADNWAQRHLVRVLAAVHVHAMVQDDGVIPAQLVLQRRSVERNRGGWRVRAAVRRRSHAMLWVLRVLRFPYTDLVQQWSVHPCLGQSDAAQEVCADGNARGVARGVHCCRRDGTGRLHEV